MVKSLNGLKQMATGLENLEVYQLACKLEKLVYKITKNFPKEEKYGRISQLRRATSSVVDNIAESYGRFGFQDRIQFLFQARGSAEEARSQLDRSREFTEKNIIDELVESYTVEIKKINGYIRFLRKKKSSG